MRLPRHDTSLSLPAEHPRDALLHDEALLSQIEPDGPMLERWWIASSPAVVVGLGLHHRLDQVVDAARCRAAGVAVLERQAGGGALLVDEHMLCGAICVPRPHQDVTESYRWLADLLTRRLRWLDIDARRVDVEEARADVAALRSRDDAVSRLLLATCYGALSPHEVVIGEAKLGGLAQIRRRHAALFQVGVLLRDQSPLADCLIAPDESTRDQLRAELARRTVGLADLVAPTGRSVSEAVAAIAGATPSEP